MGKPTAEQLQMALNEAARLREEGVDDCYIAKSLFSLNYRMRFMEDVLQKAKVYLHSGQGAHEHSALVHSIERAEKAMLASGEEDEGSHPW